MTTLMAGPPARTQVPITVRPPNKLAEQITGRTYLSHTQLNLMRACPRKFAFQYVEKAPPDFVPSSLLFGGSIHTALEVYFRARLEGREITHDAMLSAYDDAWRRERAKSGDGTPVRFNKNETLDTLHALADRMIAVFLNSPLATPNGIILGIERELSVMLNPDLPDVLARVDLVTQTDDGLHVVDFKTSRSRWTQARALESGEQLLLYGMAVGQMSSGLPVSLHFAILTKARKPVAQLLPVPNDRDRTGAMTEDVALIWQAIQDGNFYPSPSPMNCATCAFRSRCPVFGGGPLTEGTS